MTIIRQSEPRVRGSLDLDVARVLFTVDGDLMVLLHDFIKKSQKIPKQELSTAKTRLRNYQESES